MGPRSINISGRGSSGRCHVAPLLMVALAIVVVVVGEKHHHYTPTRRYPHLSTFAIMNGTYSVLREGQDDFIYCYANIPMPLTVVWRDPYGHPLPVYKGTQPPDESTGQILMVNGAYPLPYAFLVFRNFVEGLSGRYECSLLYGHTPLATRTIDIHYFEPSYRVLPLPQCLTVPLGGFVVLPSPVQGLPPRTPSWTLLEGDIDNAYVREVRGRLLLRDLKGPVAWRAVVVVDGALTFHQDVFVSVLEGGVGPGGGIGQDGGRQIIASTPTAARTCPANAHASSNQSKPSPYTASVALANDMIVNREISAFRRRLAGSE